MKTLDFLDLSILDKSIAFKVWREYCAEIASNVSLSAMERLELVQESLRKQSDLFKAATYSNMGGNRASFIREFLTNSQGEECLTCGNALDLFAPSNSYRYPILHTLFPNVLAYDVSVGGVDAKRIGHIEGNLYVSCGICKADRDKQTGHIIWAEALQGRSELVQLVWPKGTKKAESRINEDETAYAAKSRRGAMALGII